VATNPVAVAGSDAKPVLGWPARVRHSRTSKTSTACGWGSPWARTRETVWSHPKQDGAAAALIDDAQVCRPRAEVDDQPLLAGGQGNNQLGGRR
jgi:hypothetical protein